MPMGAPAFSVLGHHKVPIHAVDYFFQLLSLPVYKQCYLLKIHYNCSSLELTTCSDIRSPRQRLEQQHGEGLGPHWLDEKTEAPAGSCRD